MRDSTCYKLVVTVDGPFSSDDRAARYPSSRRLSFGSMYVTSDFSVFFFFLVLKVVIATTKKKKT